MFGVPWVAAGENNLNFKAEWSPTIARACLFAGGTAACSSRSCLLQGPQARRRFLRLGSCARTERTMFPASLRARSDDRNSATQKWSSARLAHGPLVARLHQYLEPMFQTLYIVAQLRNQIETFLPLTGLRGKGITDTPMALRLALMSENVECRPA